jgi:hypothetical protein
MIRALLFFLTLTAALSAEPLAQDPPAALLPQRLAPARIDILDTGSVSVPFEEIEAKQSDFVPVKSLDRMPPDRYYWLRLRLDPSSQPRILETVSDLLDLAQVAYRSPDGRVEKHTTGLQFPFATRQIPHRYFAFRIEPGVQTLYVQLRFTVRQHLALDLWQEEAFLLKSRREQIIFGIYYGALGIMVLYNLFLFFSIKSASYLYYVLYILTFGLYQTTLNGVSIEYLWPHSGAMDLRASFFFAGCSLFFSGLFTRHFLGVRTRSPVFNRLLLGYLALCAVWIVAAQFAPYQPSNVAGRLLGLGGIALILASCIWALKDGFRPARYFMIAWSFFLLGAVLFLLVGLGVLPRTPVTRWSMQIGSVLEVFLLSLALGDRINMMRTQKDAAEMRSRAMTEELRIASRIQNTILPNRPPQLEFVTIAVRYRPAAELGGDFYDFQPQSGGLSVLIADVCGHGVPAALIASMIKMSYASNADQHSHPDALLAAMNTELSPRVGGKFITASCLYIDSAAKRVTYSSAGHPPLLIYRPREKRLFELRMRGPVIGWKQTTGWPSVSFDLESGDRLIFYTDGIFEQRNAEMELYGFARFHNAIVQNASKPLVEFTDALLHDSLGFRAVKTALEDDVTLIAMEIV